MESYQGGFSSSALATRHGLALDQPHGIYLTDKRLIVTKEKGQHGLGWDINVGAMFGTFTGKITPFFEETPRTVNELDARTKKLDITLDTVRLIELKQPSFFRKGHIVINLTSNDSYKLLLLESPEDYGKECFNAAKELFQKYLPHALKIA